MKRLILMLFLLNCWACQTGQEEAQEPEQEEERSHHQPPTHNFTVKRLLIINDKNEMLMGKVTPGWFAPSLLYDDRQYVHESLDSLAQAYGVEISKAELRGYFSYKYEYHPYATLRAFYVAEYVSGDIIVPPNTEVKDVKWMPFDEAISNTPVPSIQKITDHILQNPDAVWGGSFMVFQDGDRHPTRMVEAFYPLFE